MIRSVRVEHGVLAAATFLITLFVAEQASALLNAGLDAGVVKRTAASPDNLNLAFGYGAHAELTFQSTFAVGVYYLRSQNPISGMPTSLDANGIFDTWGVRGRLILPMPGHTKPYVLVGLGHNWTKYRSRGTPDISGESWEAPIGFGIAHQILRIFQVSLEGAYRPSFSFSGNAYTQAGVQEPKSGWSALAGIAVDL